jgi:hypothetical protein
MAKDSTEIAITKLVKSQEDITNLLNENPANREALQAIKQKIDYFIYVYEGEPKPIKQEIGATATSTVLQPAA